VLTEDEAAWVLAWQHRPDGTAQLLGDTIHAVRGLGAYERVALDELVSEYVRLMGACERIERTAIPQAYTRHLSRAPRCGPCRAAACSAWRLHGGGQGCMHVAGPGRRRRPARRRERCGAAQGS